MTGHVCCALAPTVAHRPSRCVVKSAPSAAAAPALEAKDRCDEALALLGVRAENEGGLLLPRADGADTGLTASLGGHGGALGAESSLPPTMTRNGGAPLLPCTEGAVASGVATSALSVAVLVVLLRSHM